MSLARSQAKAALLRKSRLVTPDYDVAIVADMTIGGGFGLRLAREAQAYAAAGYRVALAHLPSARSGARICPDVQGCVASGIADPVDPAKIVTVADLYIWAPQLISEMPARLNGFRPGATTVIADLIPDYDAALVNRWLSSLFGSIQWAPTDPTVRARFGSNFPKLKLAATDRRPFAMPQRPAASDTIGHRMIIGQVGGDVSRPATIDEMLALYPIDGSFDVRLLGASPPALSRTPNQWQVIEPDSMPVGRFLNQLDALMYFPSKLELGDDSIVLAMLEGGKPVLMATEFKRVFGSGPVYCDAASATQNLRKYILDPVIRRSVRKSAVEAAARLTLGVPALKESRRRARPQAKPTALFLASNGTGLGHITTLLAIARRSRDFDPFFVSMSQALDVIQSFGFSGEHVPTASYLGVGFKEWDAWFRTELEQIIDATNARLVIYDGNGPSPGLVGAVGSRGNCSLAWIRPSMIGAATIPFSDNSRYFDVMIEPGELSLSDESPPTSAFRPSPILLLDPSELLPRDKAAAALGLDPQKTAILVQLGAGSNRDIVGLSERIVDELGRFPEVQIAIAEWSTGMPLRPRGKNVTVLRGFPFAQYYRAFDFTISAAGYNTFHEVVAYGIPTIFVANTHPSMDDQRSRARYAEANGLALELDEHDLTDLPQMIGAFMAEPARAFIRDNCRRRAFANGAVAVAEMLSERFSGSGV